MITNESSFSWFPNLTSNQVYRDYPIQDESLILAMIDVIWSPPYQDDNIHFHNCMEIGLCLEGKGIIHICGAEDQAFEPGSVVIVPGGVRHYQQNMGQPTTRWRYIAINEDRLTHDTPSRCRIEIGRLLRRVRPGGIFLLEHAMTKEIIWLIQRMFDIKCTCADEATAELEAIVLLILTRVARDPEVNTPISDKLSSTTYAIDPALLFVAESYQRDIKVVQMARACAMSESHFRKMFARLMGISPLEYLNQYRIKRAMYLLQTTNSPVSRIAEECGFVSVATFNRNFLRYNGLAPTQWRNENASYR